MVFVLLAVGCVGFDCQRQKHKGHAHTLAASASGVRARPVCRKAEVSQRVSAWAFPYCRVHVAIDAETHAQDPRAIIALDAVSIGRRDVLIDLLVREALCDFVEGLKLQN